MKDVSDAVAAMVAAQERAPKQPSPSGGDPCLGEKMRARVVPVDGHCVLQLPDFSQCLRCRGTLIHPDVGSPVSRPCKAQHLADVKHRFDAAGIPAAYVEASEAHRVTCVVADVLAPGWNRKAKGWWLYGNTGRGKSWGIAVAARAAITRRGARLQWLSMRRFLSDCKATWGRRDKRDHEMVRKAIEARVLVLDEMGVTHDPEKGTMDPYEVELVATIIEERYNRRDGVVWVTSNSSPKQLASDGKGWGMDRVVSRLKHREWMHEPHFCDGPDLRELTDAQIREAAAKQRDARYTQ